MSNGSAISRRKQVTWDERGDDHGESSLVTKPDINKLWNKHARVSINQVAK
jgi:hypothetical protein